MRGSTLAMIATAALVQGAWAAEDPKLALDYGISSDRSPAFRHPRPAPPREYPPEAPLRLEYEILSRVVRMQRTAADLRGILEAMPGPVPTPTPVSTQPSPAVAARKYRDTVEETLARIDRLDHAIRELGEVIRAMSDSPRMPLRPPAASPPPPQPAGQSKPEWWLWPAATALAAAAIALLSWLRVRKRHPARSAYPIRGSASVPSTPQTGRGDTAAEIGPALSPPRLHPAPVATPVADDVDFELDLDTSAGPTAVSNAPSWGMRNETAPAADGSAADQALELAEIMVSMGLAEGAARTLVEQIQAHPKRALPHWLRLLDIYRASGMQAEFEDSARELHSKFNIQAEDSAGDSTDRDEASDRAALEHFPRIVSRIQELWARPAECADYLSSLLEDNRGGTRAGFPLPAAEEILLLLSVLQKS